MIRLYKISSLILSSVFIFSQDFLETSNSIEENQSNIDNDKPPNTNADKIVKSESNDLEDDIPF